MGIMSKALARRRTSSSHSRSLSRHRARENPTMSPLMTGIVLTLLAGAAGALYGGLTGGMAGVYGGIEQGATLAGIGGLITGMLNPAIREGAFAVGGIGFLSELLLGLGGGVYTYLTTPKTATA